MRNKTVFISFLVVMLAIVAPAIVCGAGLELSADMVVSSNGLTNTSKIFIKNNLVRLEEKGVTGKQIMIVRGDKKLTWILNERDKTYMEIKHNPNSTQIQANPQDWEKAMLKLGTKKKIGTERVNGYDCDKYLFIYHDKRMGSQTIWISKKLKIIIKAVQQTPQGAITTEWKNIKVDNQPISLFELPKGYKKTQTPSMPPGLGKKGGMPPGIGKRTH